MKRAIYIFNCKRYGCFSPIFFHTVEIHSPRNPKLRVICRCKIYMSISEKL